MAEALVGGAVLSATLQVLLDRLASREFINFFRGRKHDGRLLKKMKLKLIGLNKVLNDAENKQITDQAVKDWLDELKDAVYHADDLVDEIATEALRCKAEAEYQSSPNQVQAPISTSTDSFDSEIESKLVEMIDILEDFKKEKDELGLREVVEQNWSHRLKDGKPHSISEKVRHFSYVQGQFDGFEKFKVIKDAKYLRTFLQIDSRTYGQRRLSKRVLDEILTSLTHLRLLSLPRYQIGELPHSIGNLIHLRFLDLSNTLVNHLPESVCTLCNLETLLLYNCHLLTTLPAEIVKLIKLRVLDLSGTNLKEMPMQMSRLKDLQQLTAFVVGKCSGSGINELKELHRLHGTISISGLENVTSGSSALEAKMREKKHIEKLALEWGSTTGDSQNETDVLEKLDPHTNLKHLEIKNYGGTRFPPWLGDQSFCYMVSLRLENCNNCFSLPPLGQLCALKELTISRMSGIRNMGQEFYGESGSLRKPFESLETLSFEEMSEWVDWCILDAGEFSRLQKLEIIKCPKLIGDLPKKVPSLVRLEIKACPELVASLPRTTSIRKLVLKECQGIQLEWLGVSLVETLQISGFANEFASELLTLTNLKELKVERCPRLLSFSELVLQLPKEMSNCYASLERLTLDGCESLISLPLGFFPKLRYLRIEQCINFETLLTPDGIELQNLQLLESLSIIFCNNMVSFPRGGLPAPKLSSLWFQSCKKLEALPEQMHTLLPSLQQLSLSDCPEIDSFPEGGLPSKLGALHIWNCKKLVGGRRVWGLQTLPSLTSFLLEGEYEDVVESFPEEGLLPSTLESLRIQNLLNLKSLNDRVFQLGSLRNMHISNCPQLKSLPEEGLPSTLVSLHIQRMPNLKSLNKSGLHLLGSLKYMQIRHCPQLQSLPEEGLPASLFELQIQGCPLLKPRCLREEGADWHKIAHVPGISIDGETILD
ncbi:hypothetical protein RHGRI_028537 [Rhododendron griersonianum]|uniref:Rx N-terminal domain-containing protein n=1 Tax=Rhododendron griersonianum TaxID=479676 RepID=A0AAV6IJM7_9ERIC|nr:hypothetical protein RHGRI_028537 [Rhododendron griersonianum]